MTQAITIANLVIIGALVVAWWRTWLKLEKAREDFSAYRYRMRREYGDDGL